MIRRSELCILKSLFRRIGENPRGDESRGFSLSATGGIRTHNLLFRRVGALSIELQPRTENSSEELWIAEANLFLWMIN